MNLAGTIPELTRTEAQPTPKQRYRGMTSTEALAIAQLRRHGHDKRQARLGRAAGDMQNRGRPGTNSTNRYDARLVRCIDFDRALSSMSNFDSTLVQMYYCDGEDQALVARALGCSIRTIHDKLRGARLALVTALEVANLL